MTEVFVFSELEEALLVLPFPYVTDLLRLLHVFIDSGWEVELVCRCILFLLRYLTSPPISTHIHIYCGLCKILHYSALIYRFTAACVRDSTPTSTRMPIYCSLCAITLIITKYGHFNYL